MDLTPVATFVLAGVTAVLAAATIFLGWQAKDSVKETKSLIQDQQRARTDDHTAAVEAVYQELVSVAGPVRMVLQHGNLAVRVPFALIAAYHQVLAPLYRGLPPQLGARLTRTYSLLDIQRAAFETMTISVHQLRLVFNEEMVPTANDLR